MADISGDVISKDARIIAPVMKIMNTDTYFIENIVHNHTKYRHLNGDVISTIISLNHRPLQLSIFMDFIISI